MFVHVKPEGMVGGRAIVSAKFDNGEIHEYAVPSKGGSVVVMTATQTRQCFDGLAKNGPLLQADGLSLERVIRSALRRQGHTVTSGDLQTITIEASALTGEVEIAFSGGESEDISGACSPTMAMVEAPIPPEALRELAEARIPEGYTAGEWTAGPIHDRARVWTLAISN